MKQEMILGEMNIFLFWSFFPPPLNMTLLTELGNMLRIQDSMSTVPTYIFRNHVSLWLFQPMIHKSSFTFKQFISEHF